MAIPTLHPIPITVTSPKQKNMDGKRLLLNQKGEAFFDFYNAQVHWIFKGSTPNAKPGNKAVMSQQLADIA